MVDQATASNVENFTLEDEPVENQAFPGLIIQDELAVKVWEDGNVSQKWHLAVRPISYTIGGKTGAWHCFAPLSKAKTAVMQSILGGYIFQDGKEHKVGQAFKDVFGRRPDGSVFNIAKGDLVGLVGLWERRDLLFTRKGGESFKFEGALFLVGPASAADVEKAKHLPVAGVNANAADPVVERIDPLPLDEVTCLVELIINNTSTPKALTAALARGLPEEVIADLANGNAHKTLVEAGLLEKVGSRYAAGQVPF